jgi:hypothetical protein
MTQFEEKISSFKLKYKMTILGRNSLKEDTEQLFDGLKNVFVGFVCLLIDLIVFPLALIFEIFYNRKHY